MKISVALATIALALAGCSKASDSERTVAKARVAASGQDAAIAPQIAYTYRFAFRLPASRIADVQAEHLALCDRMGPANCHVVSMDRQSREGRNADAGLTLAVAAPAARAFGDSLVATIGREGGDTVSRGIAGEDLSKTIVDTEARLRGRQALADRLVGIVQRHGGSVADLVAAEKALADVQQDIDTARAELADARGRVALSTIQIDYTATGGFFAPIGDAFVTMAAHTGSSIAALLTVLAVIAPWLLLLALAVAAGRWWRARRRDLDG